MENLTEQEWQMVDSELGERWRNITRMANAVRASDKPAQKLILAELLARLASLPPQVKQAADELFSTWRDE